MEKPRGADEEKLDIFQEGRFLTFDRVTDELTYPREHEHPEGHGPERKVGRSVPEFKETMDDFLQTLKSTRPAPGHERVLVPGQLEAEATAERTADGIPLHKEVVEWFRGTCAELSITCVF